MLKSSFSAILILTFGIACVGNAAPLQDDITTYALWHGDTINGVSSPDDTTISYRAAIPLVISGAGGNAPVKLSAAGEYGNCLDFSNATGVYDGRQQGSTGTNWAYDTATGNGQEIRFDAWLYIPGISCLPLPTTVGTTGNFANGAATMYYWNISNSAASAGVVTSSVNSYQSLPTNLGQARLDFTPTNPSSTIHIPLYAYYPSTGQAIPPSDGNSRNLLGKWIHVVEFVQNTTLATPWDPNYSRMEVDVTDPLTATTYSGQILRTQILSGSGVNVWLGQVSGKAGCAPYRGWRGLMDDIKISKRSHAPMVAYGPTPINGGVVSANPNLPVSWHAAAPFNPSDSVTYNVYFGTDNPPATQVASGISATSTNVGTAVFGRTYYWRVDTLDPMTGNTPVTNPSAVWSFGVNDIAPTINAGPDLVSYLVGGTKTESIAPTVVDPDTSLSLLTYQWTQTAGPAATISAPTSKNTNLVFNTVGSYFFHVTVSDGTFSGSDDIRVRIFATPCLAAQNTPGFAFQSSDFDKSCRVNFVDFALLASNWQKCNSVDPACN
jgi:hypothetical protein